MDLPSQFEQFGQSRKNGFLKVKQYKDAGGKVAGIFCTFTPLELLDAAGIVPVSLCGMSDETIPAAETRLPKNLCPLIKSSYGFALSDKCPYTYFSDLIVGESTCDGKKKMYEMLGELKNTYVLKLPQGLGEDALDFWTEELRRFRSYLCQQFSVEITDDALRKAAEIRNTQRRARCELLSLQKMVPAPAFGYDIYKTLDGTGFIFDRQEAIDRLNELSRSIRDGWERGERPVASDAKRILVTGCPIGGVLEKTVKTIESCGGVVVCFENCSGIKAAYQMVDTAAPDILRAIAARYLEIGCSVMSPNVNRFSLLRSLISEYRIDGIVEIDLQACTPYSVEAYNVKRLAGELSVPYLAVETDYSTSDSGQLSTRIEAFLEML